MDKEVSIVLENIRRMRVEREISIINLASDAGISHSYLFYIETQKKVPTLTVLNKLAKALGVRMEDFFK
jgi:transcriptional regulator with XRE-family HTH domain